MKRLLVICLALVAVAWPPIYSFYVHPSLRVWMDSGATTPEELKKFLGAKRYTVHVPEDKAGYLLSFEKVVDGKATATGGTSVEGGSDLVLLVRQNSETKKIEYCFFTECVVARGSFDDPLVGSGTSIDKTDGPVQDGDWLMLGGRSKVGYGSSGINTEFQLRLIFRYFKNGERIKVSPENDIGSATRRHASG